MAETHPPERILHSIAWGALLKILLAALLAVMVVRLYPLLISLFFALLIALTLLPLFNKMLAWRFPRWLATTLCALLIFSVVGAAIGLLVPAVTQQGSELVQRMPEFKKELMARLPSDHTRETVDHLLGASSFDDPKPLAKAVVQYGSVAIAGLSGFFVVLVIAIYFLVDGERTYQWLIAFLPPRHRLKVAAAAPEVVSLVGHYMIGQLITSALCGGFTFAVLYLLKVPSAALLALLAAILDVLPLIGIVISTLLAMAFAMTVSPATALWVGLLYFGYHLVENYFLVPKVYGDRLRLSSLVVLVACLGAVLVMGIVGAILILPIVACYPIIERLWLHPHLEPDTVKKHEQLQAEAEGGNAA